MCRPSPLLPRKKKTTILVMVASFRMLCGLCRFRAQLRRHTHSLLQKRGVKSAVQTTRAAQKTRRGSRSGTRNGPREKENEHSPTVNVEPPEVELLTNGATRSIIVWRTESVSKETIQDHIESIVQGRQHRAPHMTKKRQTHVKHRDFGCIADSPTAQRPKHLFCQPSDPQR